MLEACNSYEQLYDLLILFDDYLDLIRLRLSESWSLILYFLCMAVRGDIYAEIT